MPISSREDYLRALQILGIPPYEELTIDVVQKYYRSTMAKWHPDKNPDWRDETNDYSQQINEAKDSLLKWLKAGRPAWTTNKRQEQPRSKPPPESDPPKPPHSQPPSSTEKAFHAASSLQERLFSFYWEARFLPHWRILVVPFLVGMVFWAIRGRL